MLQTTPNLSPKFSIVVPTYNRPDCLRRCLQSLAQLDYPREAFEVVVVDDGSHQPLDDVVADFDPTIAVHLIRQANAGPASARNAGAFAARGAYLVFTDDDCQPASDWLTALDAAVAKDPQALIGGHTINALPDNLYSTASQLLIDYIYDYFNQTKGKATFFASNNFAAPSDRFRELGGFDQQFPLAAGEDREFCDRWLFSNYPLVYAPAMRIDHAHSLRFTSFWRQHVNYGRGAFYFHQVRSRRQAQPMAVEPITFYLELLAYPLRRQQGWRSLALSGLFLLSQVANVAGFFWERSRQQKTVSPASVPSA
ncbi:glycosyltransferase [Nodosilinea sp. LEGE 07088]|uniref:glycosyltransferase family 2 protein n=1 Tax=Nodosilinea sp. LEGE 07088 TaxID=2777968 RepID=UPI001882EE59|nr:glycosyltransferase [Nodosilinea sp. LEGE 07088]MBE9138521.1 glycosyltransferase [Nodosilinea sp. LEGE 07088]